MIKSRMTIALAIKENFSQDLLNFLKREIESKDFPLLTFSDLEEFKDWYGDSEEVCLLTNYSIDSHEYQTLHDEARELKTIFITHADDMRPQHDMEYEVQMDDDNSTAFIFEAISLVDEMVFEVNEKKITEVNTTSNEDDDNEKEITSSEFNRKEIQNESSQETDPPVGATVKEKEESPLLEKEEKPAPSTSQNSNSDSSINEEGAKTIAQQFRDADLSIKYENNPYLSRSRHLQKSLSVQKMEKSKTVGVWSPLHRMGVTSFVMNFAFFLAEQKVYTAVLEGLTTNHIIKDWLKRYTKPPQNWMSFASHLHTDGVKGNTEWTYKDVKFLPMDRDDILRKWNNYSLEAYMTTTKVFDISLVDMPTGEMESYTEETLVYLDELWVLVDDSVQELTSWRKYLAAIRDRYNIRIYLIANKSFPFSQTNAVATGLNAEVLTEIPFMGEETMKNYYQNQPLYFQKDVQPKLQDPYYQLAKHLCGPDFTLKDKAPTLIDKAKSFKGYLERLKLT